MNTKHTPGPWHRNIRCNGKYPVVFSGRNNHVATVSQQENGKEAEANIDLIAAAPELFEACKLAASLCDLTFEHGAMPDISDLRKVLTLCDKAISKAEGREN